MTVGIKSVCVLHDVRIFEQLDQIALLDGNCTLVYGIVAVINEKLLNLSFEGLRLAQRFGLVFRNFGNLSSEFEGVRAIAFDGGRLFDWSGEDSSGQRRILRTGFTH